jgi:Nif-specific regulatory protein/two-component system response regulator HydG
MGADLLPAELGEAAPAAAEEFTDLTKEGLRSVRESAVAAVERRFLEALMQRCEGNVSRAARESGFHRSQLQRLLAEHRIPEAGSESSPD